MIQVYFIYFVMREQLTYVQHFSAANVYGILCNDKYIFMNTIYEVDFLVAKNVSYYFLRKLITLFYY